MDQQEILQRTKLHVQEVLAGESTGHDWWHIYRVWQNARHIATDEGADLFVVELAALLHDIADWKFHGGDLEAGPRATKAWLEQLEVEPDLVDHVCEIVRRLSFKGANVKDEMPSLEGRCVQDADRLDATGAIGIARTFAYGGHAGQPIYDPEIPPVQHDSPEAYRASASPTINHFYEKLLLLQERMHTDTARRLAAERHQVMENFLAQFYREWNGEA